MNDLSSTQPCILVVGTSFSMLNSYLRSHGYNYVVLKDIRLTKNPDKKLKHRVVCDFSTQETMFKAVDEARARYNPRGVMAIYENYIVPAAEIAEYLGLPGMPIDSAKACTDKFFMRQLFAEAPEKINPDFAVVQTVDDLLAFANSHTFPLILKPANLVKSLLVTKNDNLDQLTANYQKMLGTIDSIYKKYAPRRQPKIIIEEFMVGSIHSVDAFVDSEGTPHIVDAIVDYQTGYEIGHDDNFHYSRLLPSKLSTKEVEAFRHVAVLGCRTLGMKNSPAHIEIIRTAEGPRIVEIGARIGGYRERMHKVANEIDMFGASIAIAQGHLPQLEKKRDDPCAVLELFPKISGNFVGIRNYKQAAMLPSCLQIYIKVKPGQKVGRAADGFKMCAIVILHHSNPEQFNKDLAFINESVSVQTN